MRASPGSAEVTHWMDVARLGIRLAREAVRRGRSGRPTALWRSRSPKRSTRPAGGERSISSAGVFEDQPPDLILLETLTLIRDPLTFETIEGLLETGLPVWVSFRRCRHGVCGVYGQHWGPPEGDLFGRAARRFEEMGVGALLINCLPVDHVPGILPWLRDFTDMPLGVYPNLGYLASHSWRFDDRIGPEEYAALALEWREEGRSDHRRLLWHDAGSHRERDEQRCDDTKPGRRRAQENGRDRAANLAGVVPESPPSPWLDEQARALFPLPFPELMVDPGVFVPTQGSYLLWKHLCSHRYRSRADLPRRRLRLRHPLCPARAERRVPRPRDRHRPQCRRQHAGKRFPKRCRRQDDRRGRRPVPVGADRAVRADRGEPLPDARRPVRGADRVIDLSTTGDAVSSTTSSRSSPACSRTRGGRSSCSSRSSARQRTAELLEQAGLRRVSSTSRSFRSARCSQANKEQIVRVEQLSDAFHLTPRRRRRDGRLPARGDPALTWRSPGATARGRRRSPRRG